MDAINNMRLEVISDFDKYLNKVNIGYYNEDYLMILHKISFIQTYTSLDKIDPIYEFLINN